MSSGLGETLNRRDFVRLVGAGAAATAFSAEPVIATVSGAKIKAIAFDGLAVFDVRPVAALAERVFPARGDTGPDVKRMRQGPGGPLFLEPPRDVGCPAKIDIRRTGPFGERQGASSSHFEQIDPCHPDAQQHRLRVPRPY